MKLGFYLKWPKGLSMIQGCNVIGDELYAESMRKELSTFREIESVEIFAPNHLPKKRLDVMIYLNDTLPNPEWAARHILYMQNAYGEGSDEILKKFHKWGYDGYAFISNTLLKIHNNSGFSGIYLPFGVDTNFFYPRQKDVRYDFDVAYIGNDIKGEVRTTKYLYPAVRYKFGLFGNWLNPEPSLRRKIQFWRPKEKIPEYKRVFYQISMGKIPQEEVPTLYSSVKINLNCTHQDCIDWDVVTLRTYEVLACKGFLITDTVPFAKNFMKGGMVFTDGDKDLIEKIDYYLEHKNERERISQTGYEYTIKYASLRSRMNNLLLYLKGIE